MAGMIVALGLFLALVSCGALALAVDLVPTERGLAYLVAGTTAFSAGVVTVAIGFATMHLGRLLRQPVRMIAGDEDDDFEPEPAPRSEPAAAPPPPRPAVVPPPPLPATAAPAPAMAATRDGEGPDVVGAYESAGTRYTMFSDGTVTAESPDGLQRFESLEALRQHLDRGPEA